MSNTPTRIVRPGVTPIPGKEDSEEGERVAASISIDLISLSELPIIAWTVLRAPKRILLATIFRRTTRGDG